MLIVAFFASCFASKFPQNWVILWVEIDRASQTHHSWKASDINYGENTARPCSGRISTEPTIYR